MPLFGKQGGGVLSSLFSKIGRQGTQNFSLTHSIILVFPCLFPYILMVWGLKTKYLWILVENIVRCTYVCMYCAVHVFTILHVLRCTCVYNAACTALYVCLQSCMYCAIRVFTMRHVLHCTCVYKASCIAMYICLQCGMYCAVHVFTKLHELLCTCVYNAACTAMYVCLQSCTCCTVHDYLCTLTAFSMYRFVHCFVLFHPVKSKSGKKKS